MPLTLQHAHIKHLEFQNFFIVYFYLSLRNMNLIYASIFLLHDFT